MGSGAGLRTHAYAVAIVALVGAALFAFPLATPAGAVLPPSSGALPSGCVAFAASSCPFSCSAGNQVLLVASALGGWGGAAVECGPLEASCSAPQPGCAEIACCLPYPTSGLCRTTGPWMAACASL